MLYTDSSKGKEGIERAPDKVHLITNLSLLTSWPDRPL